MTLTPELIQLAYVIGVLVLGLGTFFAVRHAR